MAKQKKVATKKRQSPKQKRPATTTKRVNARRQSDDISQEDLCCCPPRAMLWIDSQTSCCHIENKIDMRRRLQARADAAATIQIPGGAAQDSQAPGVRNSMREPSKTKVRCTERTSTPFTGAQTGNVCRCRSGCRLLAPSITSLRVYHCTERSR